MSAAAAPDRHVVGRIVVTTDTSTAELLLSAGIPAVAISDAGEALVEQVVAMYVATIVSRRVLHELATAHRLAEILTERGARPRWVCVDHLSEDLALALSTADGRDAVRTRIDQAPLWGQPDATSDAGSAHSGDPAAGLPRFPLETLPPTIRRLAEHFAQAFDAPVDLVMPAMFAALCAALGPEWRVGARSFIRSAVLWFALVAPPGMAKSPASKPILAPLHEMDRQLGATFEKRRKQYAAAIRDWKRSKRGASEMPDEPLRERVALTDVTPEGLAAAIAASPRGVLVHSDELPHLLSGMDAYHARPGTGRAFFLSLWSSERHAEGRKAAAQSESDNPFGIIFGTVQPSIISSLELSNGDGLCARFLWLIAAPSVHGLGRDLLPEMDALWRHVLRLARQHQAREVQCFDAAAAELLDGRLRHWSAEAQAMEAAGAGLMASMYGKAGDHAVRFTALLHGLDAIEAALGQSQGESPALACRPVGLGTVERAARLVDLYLAHGARVATLVLTRSDPQFGAAADDEVLVRCLRGILPVGLSVEDEPQAWADALAQQGVKWSADKVGRAFARLSRGSVAGLSVARPARADARRWRVTHLGNASEPTEVAVATTPASADTKSVLPLADASVAPDASSGVVPRHTEEGTGA